MNKIIILLLISTCSFGQGLYVKGYEYSINKDSIFSVITNYNYKNCSLDTIPPIYGTIPIPTGNTFNFKWTDAREAKRLYNFTIDTIPKSKIHYEMNVMYDWMFCENQKIVAYQKKDSAMVVLDSAATIRIMLWTIKENNKKLYGN
jgi:hypothetical protein